MEVQKTADW